MLSVKHKVLNASQPPSPPVSQHPATMASAAPETLPKPDDQGDAKVCTRYSLSKGVVKGKR